MRLHLRRALAALSLACFDSAAYAQGPSVARVAAESSLGGGCRTTDVQARLLVTGRFATVDTIDAAGVTPTRTALLGDDAVLVWSNLAFADSIAPGNVMADRVDAGRGVAVATFATASTCLQRVLDGRWSFGGCDVVTALGGSIVGATSLGSASQPAHPLMAGVTALDGLAPCRPVLTTLAQGSIVARWADGKILAAVGGTHPRRVDFGLSPPSSDCSSSDWNAATDGELHSGTRRTLPRVGPAPPPLGRAQGTPRTSAPPRLRPGQGGDAGALRSRSTRVAGRNPQPRRAAPSGAAPGTPLPHA